jgi:hypothetical protein
MDKLEHYLDQICPGIGGPRSLRQHIRQELREHLRDAVAEHRAAGMTEEQALARALEDFGGPDEVRSELAATHGLRLMAIVIDKAMQWKEKTMRAKWLWASWAHIALAVVIALEVLFIIFAAVFIAPRMQMFVREGWIGIDRSEPAIAWIPGFFYFQDWVANNTTWLLLGAAVLWGLFEWRVRSENKSLMRLSAFGTVALVLIVVVMMTGAALVLPVAVGVPQLIHRQPEPIVLNLTDYIDRSVSSIEEAQAKKDWDAIQKHLAEASHALGALDQMGAAAPTLASLREQPKVDQLRAQLKSARESLGDAQTASWDRDVGRLEAALKKFHETYGLVQAAAPGAGK